ncbi:MAG: LemA family protein [Psychroflexus sp.]|jgi:LemA protein|nr:LemA family protein [Psychroflexus sp.]MDR9448044.1 LemA family protein [Psychroflexus sp.]
MKKHLKWIIPVAIIGILILIVYSSMKGFNNKAVTLQEDVKTQWSNVESSYQRRTDLVGNLVNTVKGAADFERGTLTDVIEARSKATSVNVNAGDLNSKQLQNFSKAQSGLSSSLSRLLVSVERYPKLQANKNFLNLQAQLEGTENRINIERNKFNKVVGEYNKHIKKFPNSIFASMFGFEPMTRYQSDDGAETAPEVEF